MSFKTAVDGLSARFFCRLAGQRSMRDFRQSNWTKARSIVVYRFGYLVVLTGETKKRGQRCW